jgi:hypothetical protein
LQRQLMLPQALAMMPPAAPRAWQPSEELQPGPRAELRRQALAQTDVQAEQ